MGYHVGTTKVWIKSPRSGMEIYAVREVVGADPKTFYAKTLTNSDGRSQVVGFDATKVFWGYEQIIDADITTFEYVGSEFFKDKLHGYHLTTTITDDAEHFVLFDEFARDSINVYFGGGVFSDDAANFVRIGDSTSRFYKDLTHCWYFIYPIAEADPVTIRYVADDYVVDATHVFYRMNLLESADPDSFRILDHAFSCDANSVFQHSLKIEQADPASFRVLNEISGVDQTHCFYNGQILDDADPATFGIIDAFYSKDSKHVWINASLIEGADPVTFRVISGPGGSSRDAKFEYDMAERVGPAK